LKQAKWKFASLAGIALLLVLILLMTGCQDIRTLFQNPNYLYEDGAVLVNGADQPVVLANNAQAVDVSFVSLLDFIRQDPTDQLTYVERDNPEGLTPFVCSDFAEMVHNHAESAGIRAGYVSIDWVDGEIGHAINAFNTTDQGLVFIDCTGPSQYSQLEESANNLAPDSWDKVAYLLIGHKYGVINIDYAESGDYAYFERFEDQWQELKDQLATYNAEVKLYNQEIRDQVFVEDTPEIDRVRAWEKALTIKEDEIHRLSDKVGYARFRPLGIVDNYDIHW
jgi:hypothetical protein